MTAILWQENRIYADSVHLKGGEIFHSLSKVKKLDKPLRIRLPKNSRRKRIDDWVFGWVSTGSNWGAERFVHYFEAFENQKALYDAYEGANLLGLANDDNAFEVIFIGAKNNYSFRMDGSEDPLTVQPHSKMFALGSGGHRIAEYKKKFTAFDPLRLMQLACHVDDMSGGMIDVWEFVPAGKRSSFKRIGIYEPDSKKSFKQLVADINTPCPITWTSNHVAKRKHHDRENSSGDAHGASPAQRGREKDQPGSQQTAKPDRGEQRNDSAGSSGTGRVSRNRAQRSARASKRGAVEKA